MRRSACAVASIAAGLVVTLPGVAGAAPPVHERFRDSGQEVIRDFCGTGERVRHTFDVRGHAIEGQKNAVFAFLVQGRETFTYKGTTVIGHFAGRSVDRIVEGAEDGPHVHEFTVTGKPESFRLQGGRMLTKDVGRIVFRVAFDAQDNVISDEIVFVAGPHPSAEGGFELFCRVIPEALGIPTEG